MNKRHLLRCATLCAIPLLSALPAQAQDFPRGNLTIVVGFAAGGAADSAARIIGKKLGENLGLSLIHI